MSTQDSERTEKSWRRTGCLALAVLLGLILTGAAITVAVGYQQLRSESREMRSSLQAVPREPGGPADVEPGEPSRTGRIELDLSVVQLTVVPAEAGEPIRVDAEFDPRYYRLDQTTEDDRTYRIRFGPISSTAMALLRVKLGGEPPVLRIALPRDVSLTLIGETYGTFAAFELGGLRLDTVDMEVSGGAVAISFLEPLQAPMEHLSLRGDKGSVKVVGLGAASPRTTVIQQHLGEIDVDLRGPWTRDSDIQLKAFVAGGSVWLPSDVDIEGLDGRLSTVVDPSPEEISRPRMRLSVTERGGRLVFVD